MLANIPAVLIGDRIADRLPVRSDTRNGSSRIRRARRFDHCQSRRLEGTGEQITLPLTRRGGPFGLRLLTKPASNVTYHDGPSGTSVSLTGCGLAFQARNPKRGAKSQMSTRDEGRGLRRPPQKGYLNEQSWNPFPSQQRPSGLHLKVVLKFHLSLRHRHFYLQPARPRRAEGPFPRLICPDRRRRCSVRTEFR